MAQPTTSRKSRSAQLSESGRRALESKLSEIITANRADRKLTWDAKAELLGLSVATTRKLLGKQAIDRSTAVHAFSVLSLEFRGEYLIESSAEPAPAPDSATAVVELPQKPSRPLLRKRIVLATIAVVFVIGWAAAGWWFSMQKIASDREKGAQYERAVAAFHNGRYAESKQIVQSLIAETSASKDPTFLNHAVRLQGDLAAAEGDLESAVRSYERSLELQRAFGYANTLPPLQETLGEAYWKLGRYKQAQEVLLESLAGFRAAGDSIGQAMALRHLCSVAHSQGDYDSALKRGQECLDLLKQKDEPGIRMDLAGRMAMVYADTGSLVQAEIYATDALNYWQKQGHPRWIALAKRNLGYVRWKAGTVEEAVKLIEESKAGYAAAGDRYGVAQAESLLAKITATKS